MSEAPGDRHTAAPLDRGLPARGAAHAAAGERQATVLGPEQHAADDPRIAVLRERGAPTVDPVRLRYIEALARRSAAHGGETRQLLDARLAHALARCGEALDRAQGTPRTVQGPGARGAGHDSRAGGPEPVSDGTAGPAPRGKSRLAELLDRLDRPAAAAPGAGRGELKTMSQSRSTWARLRVDEQLARSLEKIPENPGPLNSHLLMLRALRAMQDIAPAYLARFMSYADALLWLDHAGSGSLPAAAPAVRREVERKRKPGRGRAV